MNQFEMLGQGWRVQWFNTEKQQKWKIRSPPNFKECKKRKEFFSEEFSEIWYKSPFKYHMHLEVENMSQDDYVLAYVDLHYEDGQKIVDHSASKTGVISKNEKYFVHHMPVLPSQKMRSEVTIGPYTFNICSYKQDGRKFRMMVYLLKIPNNRPAITSVDQLSSQQIANYLITCLISPPFIIRAKKPGGIRLKKKMNKRKVDGLSCDAELAKKLKIPPPLTPPQVVNAPTVPQIQAVPTTIPQQQNVPSHDEVASDEEIHASCIKLFEVLKPEYKRKLVHDLINLLNLEESRMIHPNGHQYNMLSQQAFQQNIPHNSVQNIPSAVQNVPNPVQNPVQNVTLNVNQKMNSITQ